MLRLLLAVAKQLSPEQLGRYLQTTIQRSRKSRRRARASVLRGCVAQQALMSHGIEKGLVGSWLIPGRLSGVLLPVSA